MSFFKKLNGPFFKVFLFQLLTIFTVIAVFKLAPSKKVGGVIAGLLFATQSFGILFYLHKQSLHKVFSFWAVLFQLVTFILPLWLWRVINYQKDFAGFSLYGLSHNEFHKMSEKIYVLVMLVVLFEGLSWFFKNKKSVTP